MAENTFNLSILFDDGKAIGTIVCYSEQTIDQTRVQAIVNQKIYMMIQSGEMCQAPKKVVETIALYLVNLYPGLQTVIVPSNACVAIRRMPLRPNSNNDAEQM